MEWAPIKGVVCWWVGGGGGGGLGGGGGQAGGRVALAGLPCLPCAAAQRPAPIRAAPAPSVPAARPLPAVFLFLLTTRVGGLGVNLTGADRVLLYE